jgi:CyaY protein
VTETEFNQAVDAIFLQIEAALDARDTDIDYETAAGILTLEFEDGSKIILNRQGPTQEIWIAAKSGGYHYRLDGGAWRNTRDGSELFAALSGYISQQAGQDIRLTPDA